ncbi:aldose epimerase family protein [Lentilactobacillus sp. SPB1-3]|uniref:Aldose epimerase family protein n=1 Tax=Lentilactobacillus terminaliae TaxID=3003483 RepID=A0ACD5DEU0_9LACO|nr:aldose epimerase family protein [Lentilactobacillus sp. SPB1-3]MCZ0977578.1 galactose mutarotase [Lentilactobacillus sp. SPB1-3]
MKFNKESFGSYKGMPVSKYTITNKNNVSISVLTLGGVLYEFLVPSTNNADRKNIIVNFNNAENYLDNPFYFCMAIGRTAGRITNGTYELNGKTFHLDQNEGNTTLHGGSHGFSSFIWEGSTDNNSIILTKHINSSDDSFPGNLDAKIEYSLSDDNELTIKYTATSSEDTLFNPTQHIYFNLGNTNNVLNHALQINSSNHLDLNKDDKTPTGMFLNVESTVYDFNNPQKIGDAVKNKETQTGSAFDDVFVINEHQSNEPIAVLNDPETQRSVTISSDRNGLVVFTPDDLSSMSFKDYGIGKPYMGIALEAQNLPDAVNHEGFGNIVLPANKETSYSISYKAKF